MNPGYLAPGSVPLIMGAEKTQQAEGERLPVTDLAHASLAPLYYKSLHLLGERSVHLYCVILAKGEFYFSDINVA